MTLACILYSCLHDYVDKSMELNRQQTIVLLMEIEELKVVMEKEKERSKGWEGEELEGFFW